MYQDKIAEKANTALFNQTEQRGHKNIFVLSGFAPLDFIPDEDTCDATHIARDILNKRSNEDIVTLSKTIDYMLHIGDNLLDDLSMQLLKDSTTRKSITLTQARSLYLLCDYYELSTLSLKKVQWGELFATLTLMQSVEIVFISAKSNEQDEYFKEALEQTQQHCINELKEEVIDSIARAECLFDKKIKSSSIAKAGGKAKSRNTDKLKKKVIQLYEELGSFQSYRSAGKAILKKLEGENSQLLLLSFADDKAHRFSIWIGEFEDKKKKQLKKQS